MRPLFYDTETTGIQAEKDRVIEIALFDPVHDKTFEQLIHPEQPIPAEATAVHHITDAMVAEAPKFSQIIEDLTEFCEGEVVLIAHNNDQFDIHFLRAEFKRAGKELPSQWKFFDTLKWARRYRPDLPRHSLQFLRESYGIAANQAHRALDDVKVLYEVFRAMTDDLSLEILLQLMTAASQPRKVTHMPFGKHKGKQLASLPRSYVRWLSESGALDKPENSSLKEGFHEAGLLSPA